MSAGGKLGYSVWPCMEVIKDKRVGLDVYASSTKVLPSAGQIHSRQSQVQAGRHADDSTEGGTPPKQDIVLLGVGYASP